MGCHQCSPSRGDEDAKPLRRSQHSLHNVFGHPSTFIPPRSQMTLATEGLDKLYKKILQPYQFKVLSSSSTRNCNSNSDVSLFDYPSLSKDNISTSAYIDVKVASELLPLNLGSSIFVFIKDNDPSSLKAMIAGSAFTPYAHGLFEFDINLQEGPNMPPKIQFCTTGGNKVCFSAYLPSSGVVDSSKMNGIAFGSLESLTGTVDISQVLLSLQDLLRASNILAYKGDHAPVNSEPEEAMREYKAYCNVIKYATILHAMVQMLENPPAGLETFVQTYFCLKKEIILKECRKWLSEAQLDNGLYDRFVKEQNEGLADDLRNGAYFPRLSAMIKRLEKLLGNIVLNEDSEVMDTYRRRQITCKDADASIITI